MRIRYFQGLGSGRTELTLGQRPAILFFIFFIISFCVPVRAQDPAPQALFVSQIQDPPVFSSREEITRLVAFAKEKKIKILFVQVYRSNKSWFPSRIADSEPYHDAVAKVGEDPLALLILEAHRAGLEVHAWMNLLSLGANTDAFFLKKYGPDILTRNTQKKRKIEDYKIDDQYFLEPGDLRVRTDLTILVEEVVKTYPHLDGIQFDYIRYPDMHPHYGYTQINMDRYKKANGVTHIDEESDGWKQWKRDQVTELLFMLKEKARSLHPAIQVSTTGCMPYSRAYHEAFQDWATWVGTSIVDFVTIMDYSDVPEEYEQGIENIKVKIGSLQKIKIGVGAYKFLQNPDVFEKELLICRRYGVTCAVFHYGSLLKNSKLGEKL